MSDCLIIQGTLLTESLNLVNVYGPNVDDANFYVDLFLTLSASGGSYIIGKDFNCTLNPGVGRSTGIDQSHNGCRTTIHHFMKDLVLVDSWRECNSQAKIYSCYSSTFQTYSRIDYFLISSELRSKIHNSFYDSIVILDHAPCYLVYKYDRLTKDPPRRCFQHKWLQDKEFVKYAGKQIEEFFKINTTQTTACIRWEAFKAFLRGHIISYTGSKSKKAREERLDLEKKMKTLQEKVYETNNPQLEKELLILRSEYDKHSDII